MHTFLPCLCFCQRWQYFRTYPLADPALAFFGGQREHLIWEVKKNHSPNMTPWPEHKSGLGLQLVKMVALSWVTQVNLPLELGL